MCNYYNRRPRFDKVSTMNTDINNKNVRERQNEKIINNVTFQMPKRSKRKAKTQNWTEEQVNNAILAIKKGTSMKQAGKDFRIPESILREKLKEIGEEETSVHGRKPIFNENQEREIASHINDLSVVFYDLTPTDVRRMAYNYAQQNRVHHNFNRETNLAGRGWLAFFVKRNPSVCLRDKMRSDKYQPAKREDLILFYSNLQKLYEKYHFPAFRIYNEDETDVSKLQRNTGKIYMRQNGRNIGVGTTGNNITITMLCCANAAGEYIPPMIIYPSKRRYSIIRNIGAIQYDSPNGWTSNEIFFAWLRHFQNVVKATKENPVLLIIDTDESHVSVLAYDFCQNNNIILIAIPPNSSKFLHPLSLSFFGPLKEELFSQYHLFKKNNPNSRTTTPDLVRILSNAHDNTSTIENAIQGFQESGIFPLYPHDVLGLFYKSELKPKKCTEKTLDDFKFDEKNELLLSPDEPQPGPSNVCLENKSKHSEKIQQKDRNQNEQKNLQLTKANKKRKTPEQEATKEKVQNVPKKGRKIKSEHVHVSRVTRKRKACGGKKKPKKVYKVAKRDARSAAVVSTEIVQVYKNGSNLHSGDCFDDDLLDC